MIVTKPLKRLPTCLSHKGSGPGVIWKKVLKNNFLFFLNEISVWVIVTRPLKRLPTYLSHRGLGPNVVWKKKFWKMIFFFWNESLFFWKKSNSLRMRLFEIVYFWNEQKVILWTTFLTNHNAQLLTRSHWLGRIWNH